MPTKKLIGVALTRRDADIIAWANMLMEHGESPNIWIQAILAAETMGIDFDVGTVYLPPKHPNKAQTKKESLLLFGDDTKQTAEQNSKTFGWTVRGANGEYTVGSVLNVGASRESTKIWLETARQQHKILSRYIKIIVRKHIHVTHEGPNRMPNLSGPVDDFFIEFPLTDTHRLGAQKTSDSVAPIQKPPKKNDFTKPAQPARSSLSPDIPTAQDDQAKLTSPPDEAEQGRGAATTGTPMEQPPQETKRKNPLLLHVT